MSNILVSAKAIILAKNKFIILKQTRPTLFYWDLPGGKIQYGESPEETVIREVKEETGIDIIIDKLFDTYWFFSPTHKHQVICITFLCKPKKYNVDITHNPADDEHIEEFKWVTQEEFLNSRYPILHESLRTLINKL